MRLLIILLTLLSSSRADTIADIWGVVDIEGFVSRATAIQLHSIDPAEFWTPEEKKPEGEFFHHYRSLGSVRPTDKERLEKLRQAILAALRSIRWGEPPVLCFEPRHGVRLEREGEVFEILICFECSNSEVHYAGKYQMGPIGRLGQKEMDALLDEHSVPRVRAPEKPEPNKPVQHNAESRPSSGDSPASETPSAPAPRG